MLSIYIELLTCLINFVCFLPLKPSKFDPNWSYWHLASCMDARALGWTRSANSLQMSYTDVRRITTHVYAHHLDCELRSLLNFPECFLYVFPFSVSSVLSHPTASKIQWLIRDELRKVTKR